MGEYFCTRWLILRLLGIVYLIAFLSFLVQALGLVGSNGILPAALFLNQMSAQKLVVSGPGQFLMMPTLFWFNCSDAAINAVTWLGAFSSLLVVLGVLTLPALIACFICYLSIVTIGQDFMSFQWDMLLLETGFLAVFLAPFQMLESPWKRAASQAPPSVLVIWLFRFLLFKLMFMSGCVKLLSHDPTWSNLTALDYHYWTQPLPTPPAYFANQLPELALKISVGIMFFIELLVPFLFFCPRRLRLVGAFFTFLLQMLIAVTGNYTYFNFLTMILCLSLLDDQLLRAILPKKLVARMDDQKLAATSRLRKAASILVVALLIPWNLSNLSGRQLFSFARDFYDVLTPFGICNGYGLFAVMTTERIEIVVEGSNDGKTWYAYEFPFKPGDLKRAPPVVAPYQPRLDWQMWFAALGDANQSPWFTYFMLRLLQGSPEVLKLLQKNPFPDKPPQFVRALKFNYTFTSLPTLNQTGRWWQRQDAGLFFPVISLSRSESSVGEERPQAIH